MTSFPDLAEAPAKPVSGEHPRCELPTASASADPSLEVVDSDAWDDLAELPDDGYLPAPGELLTPTLRIVRAIASGGQGSVWVAEHLTLQIEVAVKFLRRALAQHPVALRRFQREAAAAAKLRSPHVVQVFDHGCSDKGVPFIVMELLEGETLQQRWERQGTFTLEQTAEIVRQTGRALTRAHDLGIVHRDIKPENIFLVSGGTDPFVKVLDFGIAKSLDDTAENVTSLGAVIGTPQFMSPEQMMGEASVGPASDVWSLGVVAYALLTGHFPYEGTNLAKLAVEIERGDPKRASLHSNEVTDAIDAWLSHSLCQQTTARYADARAMMQGLEAALCSSTRTAPTAELTQLPVWTAGTATQSLAPGGSVYKIRGPGITRSSSRAGWWGATVALAVAAIGFVSFAPVLREPHPTKARSAAGLVLSEISILPVAKPEPASSAIELRPAPAAASSTKSAALPSASAPVLGAGPTKTALPKRRRNLGF